VAIVSGKPGKWRCKLAVSSYDELYEKAGTTNLIQAVDRIANAPITIAAVDMPLATVPVIARRDCDNQISRTYGACGCGVHSSTPERPGKVSADLMAEFRSAGFELAVSGTAPGQGQILEVYPHIAVIRLLGENYRVPYKVGRAPILARGNARAATPEDPPESGAHPEGTRRTFRRYPALAAASHRRTHRTQTLRRCAGRRRLRLDRHSVSGR
jgi:hypothetical protein